jgi:hypothetical protein
MKADQDKLEELYLRLRELYRKEYYMKHFRPRLSLEIIQKEIIAVRASIAEILDRRAERGA